MPVSGTGGGNTSSAASGANACRLAVTTTASQQQQQQNSTSTTSACLYGAKTDAAGAGDNVSYAAATSQPQDIMGDKEMKDLAANTGFSTTGQDNKR